ncbi:MAG: tRNA (adenosine(37)-N6)-threonylcarbamoyltransferase complex ATPase subunit type 1 TsaE [Ignavibacteriae bacterium]|nr:tRNA (adenosine(37)-N6)-threonylcarbamoyltransferase complex ATPase subunit type 1 TsaE [Ignavibacteriota bacterium]MCB9216405.1 tRNA (adenosine(37)-N6)-threonylcarbamoyltransferase complex ATPase subunit type 1 TsaE [Ignavibacteria bacterium]
MEPRIYTSMCEEETFRLGFDMASDLRSGDTVALYGDLGAGKTEFIKGVCEGLSVDEIVSSPTFTIVNQYAGKSSDGRGVIIYHIDLYRVESVDELEEIGLPETLADPLAIKLIEWSEHGTQILPMNRVDVRFTALEGEENCRKIEVQIVGLLEGAADLLS